MYGNDTWTPTSDTYNSYRVIQSSEMRFLTVVEYKISNMKRNLDIIEELDIFSLKVKIDTYINKRNKHRCD